MASNRRLLSSPSDDLEPFTPAAVLPWHSASAGGLRPGLAATAGGLLGGGNSAGPSGRRGLLQGSGQINADLPDTPQAQALKQLIAAGQVNRRSSHQR
jgi:hypothetical protein